MTLSSMDEHGNPIDEDGVPIFGSNVRGLGAAGQVHVSQE